MESVLSTWVCAPREKKYILARQYVLALVVSAADACVPSMRIVLLEELGGDNSFLDDS